MIPWTIQELEERLRGFRYTTGRDVLRHDDGKGRVGDEGHRYSIFTSGHEYRISAVPASAVRPKGYLGCIASCRTPVAGEDWTRGNDLPDGPLSESTWNAILSSIVGMEMVSLSPMAWPKALDPAPSPQPRGVPGVDTVLQSGSDTTQ